jgi:flagellar hook-associated protein 1
VLASTLAGRLNAQGLRLFVGSAGGVPDPAASYAGSSQLDFAGRIRLNPAVEANPALLRDGTHAVAGSAGGPTAFTPNGAGGPAGFTTLLDFGLGTQAAAGAPWPAIRTGGLGPDGTLSSPFSAPQDLEAYAARVAAAQTGDRAAATEARTAAEALRGALEQKFSQQSGIDPDAEMAAMVALQNAYAANARVLGTVQSMWDSLLAAVR